MTSVAYAALWIFIFAVPWDRLITLPGVNIVTKVTGIVALGMTSLAIVMSGKVRRWRTFHIAAFLFVVWAGVGVWFVQKGAIPQKFYTFVQLLVMLWMVWELAPTLSRLRGLLAAYVFGACIPALGTIFLYLERHGELRRFSAGGADANSLAMTLAIAMPIAWYLSITSEKPTWRWIYRAYLPLGLLASALTGSRGGMLAWMVALLIIPLTMTLSPGRMAAVLGMLALSGSLIVAYVPDRIVQRLGSTTSSVESVNFGGRFRLWVAGVHAFEAKPLMGYGTGAYITAITPEVGADALVAHNSFLSVLVEEGIIGLLLFVIMLSSVFFAVLHLPKTERRFGLVLLATVGTAMLPLTWEHRKAVWFVTSVLMNMCALEIARVKAVRAARVGGPAWVGSPAVAPVARGAPAREVGEGNTAV
jgi:O-antigen ligase